MLKKKPLAERVKEAQQQPAKPGHERTAEGLEVPTPTQGAFFSNLEKASKPKK
jgi:hypothetical protein